MQISLSWLKSYVDIDVSVEELCDKMVMSGFEVESMEDLSKTMDNVVVGKIVKLEKHPDADKLQICQIDVGAEEPVQIITGAQNVFEGAFVPAALHDSHLPNGMHIKKGKLRGLPSLGMLCSGEELCLKEEDFPGAGVYGILILPEKWAVGTDMRDVLGLWDYVIDFKITANRPDCQSVLGVAREAAVALKKPFNKPQPTYKTVGGDIHNEIAITVEDTDLCPRYMGRVVKNLRIAPSPEWMKARLKAAGMRPINNIVDITNYVMLETGHPMHAFDMRDITGNQIIVRRATEGETITTLDEKDHTLTPEMLVIADAKAPSCLAGIMGGLNSEIKDDTTDLFFECAKFRRDNVRRTARALGMRTESSARFEKGVDIVGVEYAMERALQLIDELDAGDIYDGVIDCRETLPEKRKLVVESARICELLGVDIPMDEMVNILNRLEIETTEENGVLTCLVPSFRDDIEGRADLAEEVMRIYGYDHIVGTPMRGSVMRGKRLFDRDKDDKLKASLTAAGLQEITTYSFINPSAIEPLNLPADDARRQMIPILNPLGEEYSVLRTQLLTNMLTVLSTNYNRKMPAVRFFERSKVFQAKSLPLTEQPLELPALCIGLYGADESFLTLKGLVEMLLARFGIVADYTASSEPYLHPGRQAVATVNGEAVAVFGELHPDTADAFELDTRVYVAEVQLTPIYAVEPARVLYKPLPKFPAMQRDIALLANEDLPVADIERWIKESGGKLLEKIALFDVYQGTQIAAGMKSVAYNLTFRSAESTLTDAECDRALQKIFKHLSENGCILRS